MQSPDLTIRLLQDEAVIKGYAAHLGCSPELYQGLCVYHRIHVAYSTGHQQVPPLELFELVDKGFPAVIAGLKVSGVFTRDEFAALESLASNNRFRVLVSTQYELMMQKLQTFERSITPVLASQLKP